MFDAAHNIEEQIALSLIPRLMRPNCAMIRFEHKGIGVGWLNNVKTASIREVIL